MNPESRAYSRLVAGVLFLFLLLSDWVILNGPRFQDILGG